MRDQDDVEGRNGGGGKQTWIRRFALIPVSSSGHEDCNAETPVRFPSLRACICFAVASGSVLIAAKAWCGISLRLVPFRSPLVVVDERVFELHVS